nr:solute carrier family 40 member 2 [Quercus suber]
MSETPESETTLRGGETSDVRLSHSDGDRESSHFLAEDIQDNSSHQRICNLLYISHSLSAWNSRAFEFGAFLFLSAIYPQTLLPASIYALTRAGSAALLSTWLGTYVDSTELGQRFSVAASCLILFLGSSYPIIREAHLQSIIFLALLCSLAAIEKLSAIINTISIERDWVIVLAQDNESRLRTLNSRMRRIDLFCKLAGPLAISLLGAVSLRAAIAATGIMTVLSIGIEYFAVAKVYQAVPALHTLRIMRQTQIPPLQARAWDQFRAFMSGTITYFQHPAFLPSFALALLYLTVLSFAGQMITYLLSLGVSPTALGILRGVAAIFEMSATWVAPKIMERIGPIRAGIWFLNFQFFCVSIACLFLWVDVSPRTAAVGLVCAVVASRIGLWGFDLSAQIIIQENIFEMISFASTVVLPDPNQFKYPAALSTVAVALAGVLYAVFVRARRGHLVHLSQCIERTHKSGRHHDWERVPGEEHTRHSHELT